jgi:hypothetical protein
MREVSVTLTEAQWQSIIHGEWVTIASTRVGKYQLTK